MALKNTSKKGVQTLEQKISLIPQNCKLLSQHKLPLLLALNTKQPPSNLNCSQKLNTLQILLGLRNQMHTAKKRVKY